MKKNILVATIGAAGLVALTGCTTVETPQPTAAPTPAAPTNASTSVAQQPVPSQSSATTPVGDGSGQDDSGNAAIPPCTAANITPTLGDITPSDVQSTVPLRYTNSGPSTCNVTGFPGATLTGPDFNGLGPNYDLARDETTQATTITLQPGTAAVATLTLGTVNKNDEKAWIPMAFLTTAPGDTTVMSLPFPNTVGVQRQDGATHPASYIGVFTGPIG